MTTLTVQKNRVGPIRGRHPWVFSGALKQIPEGLKSGEPVALADEQGNFLAQGYFNSYSQISVRLWSWDSAETVDRDFFIRRVRPALELRQRYVENKDTNAYRLVNAENDLLPGLVVDRYDKYLAVQFHTNGIAVWKKEIVDALAEVVRPAGIYERSDVRDRRRDAVDQAESAASAGKNLGLLYGEVPELVKIKENGHWFWVDIIGGQKTGFFLDQRDKRQALAKYVGGKKVLNCFSYTGGFSVCALAGEAEQVVSVDASEPALELAEKNVKLNKLDETKAEYILADVKEYLADRSPGEFDVIILDPPAFIKDRHKIKEGIVGYRSLNEHALRILPPGGILVTCSCSAHLPLQDFRYMLTAAASRAGRTVQIIETFTHGIDHPVLAAFTEGEYLKCLIALVR